MRRWSRWGWKQSNSCRNCPSEREKVFKRITSMPWLSCHCHWCWATLQGAVIPNYLEKQAKISLIYSCLGLQKHRARESIVPVSAPRPGNTRLLPGKGNLSIGQMSNWRINSARRGYWIPGNREGKVLPTSQSETVLFFSNLSPKDIWPLLCRNYPQAMHYTIFQKKREVPWVSFCKYPWVSNAPNGQ